MKESNIQRRIMLELSKAGARLFRVNVAFAWVGNKVIKINHRNKNSVQLENGDVVIREGRPLKTGVPVGYPDLTGFAPLVITNEMVGQTLPIYTAIEVKNENGRASPEQLKFLEVIKNANGFAGIARSEAEAMDIINGCGES